MITFNGIILSSRLFIEVLCSTIGKLSLEIENTFVKKTVSFRPAYFYCRLNAVWNYYFNEVLYKTDSFKLFGKAFCIMPSIWKQIAPKNPSTE